MNGKKYSQKSLNAMNSLLYHNGDVFSNENKVKEKASLYSPAMNYKEAFTKYGKPFMNEMPDAHIQDNLQVTSLYYRSITSSVCGSPENRDNKFKIRDMFPDFY